MLDFEEKILKYAVVDIGANSVRMNIYDIDTQTGEFSVCASARSMLGLAAYAKNGTTSVMATLASQSMTNLFNSIYSINQLHRYRIKRE